MSALGTPKNGGWLKTALASPVKVMCLVSAVFFLAAVQKFYDPNTGFSSLISIGDRLGENKVSQLKGVQHYIYEDSSGYDGAYYVQLALNPTLDNPELNKSIDNLPYRAKRILFCWAAWVLGLGQAAWVVQAHALLNVLCWLALAWVLLRWFPPTNWENFARWAAVMFSHGVCMSVRHSLVDAPSLLLVALAMRWVEEGHRTRGAAVLALAGLGKETSLLAVAGVADFDWKSPRTWARPVLTAAAVAVPLFAWMGYVRWKFGPAADPGLGNFTLPLAGLAEKWGDALGHLSIRGDSPLKWATVATVVALTVQWMFFALRWRPAEAWWRIGAAFAGMMVFLSTPVWEGFPGASTRVLLPMTLAFNIVVPRGRKWLAVLIAGNLSVIAAYKEFTPPAREFYHVAGESAVVGAVRVELGGGWSGPENFNGDHWRWSAGKSEVRIRNAAGGPLKLAVTGYAAALDKRTLRVLAGGGKDGRENEAMLWSGDVAEKKIPFRLGLIVPEGETTLRFESDKPGRQVGTDPRKLSFNVFNLEFVVTPSDGPR
jgi:hypothetical protein